MSRSILMYFLALALEVSVQSAPAADRNPVYMHARVYYEKGM